MPTNKPPRRPAALKIHLEDLARPPVERYVRVQRERGRLLSIDNVDVDLENIVDRPFLCDRHRCIQWSPHDDKAKARALIDNSCCSRYSVPVTDFDRTKLLEILPKVRKRLAKDHPLNAKDPEPPFEMDEEYAFTMREAEGGACQFVLYEAGLTTCAIHKTCLEEGLDVWHYKPLGCSLWPLALVDYEKDGAERFLLTVYGRATHGLFEDGGDADDEDHFACLVDQDPSYEPLYRTMEGVLTQALGEAFYRKLDKQARKHLASPASARS